MSVLKDRSWPLGIVTVLALFIGMTVWFVKTAFSERVDLVSPDYYYRDKTFSERLKKENRLNAKGQAEISRTDNGVAIQLPAAFSGKKIGGKLIFYSPLNPADDFQLPVSFTGNEQRIATALKTNQIWKVALDFESAGETYFFERTVR
jgi:hypothetical protein